MTPPNITKGEWTVAAESGQWWVTDQDYQELPETEENARFMSASKKMGEALHGVMTTLWIEGTQCSNGVTSWRCNRLEAAYLDARRALLQAGYTE